MKIETNRKQIEEANGQITELENGREGFRTEIRTLQDQVNKIQLNELQDQVQHWSVNCAVLRKSVSETENRIRENAAEAEKNRRKQSQLTEYVRNGEKNAEELRQRLAEAENEADGLRGRYADAVKSAEKLEEEGYGEYRKLFE